MPNDKLSIPSVDRREQPTTAARKREKARSPSVSGTCRRAAVLLPTQPIRIGPRRSDSPRGSASSRRRYLRMSEYLSVTGLSVNQREPYPRRGDIWGVKGKTNEERPDGQPEITHDTASGECEAPGSWVTVRE